MNFVADESVDRQIVERLRRGGDLVTSIAESSPGDPDEEVLAKANASKAVLLTADTDFGELVFRLEKSTEGILLIRLAGIPPERKARIVESVVHSYGAVLKGAFCVLTQNSFRIRQTPGGRASTRLRDPSRWSSE